MRMNNIYPLPPPSTSPPGPMTDTDNTPPSFTWLSSRLSGHLSRPVQHQLSVSTLDGLAAHTYMNVPPWVGLDVMAGGEGLVLLPGNRLPDCRTVPMRDPGAVPTNDCKYPITPPPLPLSRTSCLTSSSRGAHCPLEE